LIQNNIMFAYDSTDSTTVHDGVTCLVSSEGKRFKAATLTPPYSVLTKGTVAQPGSPTVGDAYLIPTAATGASWAGKDTQIGIYTAAGWRFAVSPIGRFLYVKDETAFYHRNASGTWTAGVGSIVLGANAVNLTNVLGANASFMIKVENQTTNTPPGSPTAPTAYIIGSSPTGAWSGNAGKLAICLVNGAFTIITPATGDEVYDKAQSNNYRFNGTSWVSSIGAWRNFTATGTKAQTSTITGSGNYSWSTTAPTTSTGRVLLDSRTIAAQSATSTLRIEFCCGLFSNVNDTGTIAIFKDAVASAILWAPIGVSNVQVAGFSRTWSYVPGDTSSHTYRAVFVQPQGATYFVEDTYLSIEESS
jgi:hypothetical protein